MAKPYIPHNGPIVTLVEARAAGATWFFTGVLCKRRHLSERHVSNRMCRDCVVVWQAANHEKMKAIAAAYRKANPDKERARSAAWKKANPQKTGAWAAAWRKANPEKRKTIIAKWRLANPEKENIHKAAWKESNPEKTKAINAAWRKANPEAVRSWNHKRRARKREASGSWTPADIAILLKQQGGKCAHPWCRKSLKSGFHRDHRVPLALSGTNDWRNIQLLCEPCNLAKHTKHPIDFAQLHGLLL